MARRSGCPSDLAGLSEQLRRAVAIGAGMTAGSLSRRLGFGGGTALPGVVAGRLHPSLLGALADALPGGCVLVSGTNGKTTTARLIADSLRLDGYHPVANREGSNLAPGVLGALMADCDRLGRPRAGPASVGVLELDEAALPPVAATTHPRLVVLTNLFRDQLDRYFELDFLHRLWQVGLARLPATTTLVLNCDDPQLAWLGLHLPNATVTFGLEDLRHATASLQHCADARRCPSCGQRLEHAASFYSHLGHYECRSCGFARPAPDVWGHLVELRGDRSVVEVGRRGRSDLRVEVRLGGLHNAYNALAAIAAGQQLGVSEEALVAAPEQVQVAFGRGERASVQGRKVLLALAKNPCGLDLALRWLAGDGAQRFLLLGLNDADPDGRDVSWVWDAELEALQPPPEWVICTGRRSRDMALRCRYAGWDVVDVLDEPDDALEGALARVPEGLQLSVVATYTAMWSIREILVRGGRLPPFWAGPSVPPLPRAQGPGHGAQSATSAGAALRDPGRLLHLARGASAPRRRAAP